MGQKVHPIGFRLGIIKDWHSRWFARRGNYADLLQEDIKIRNFINRKMPFAGISTIDIERIGERVSINLFPDLLSCLFFIWIIKLPSPSRNPAM